MLLGGLFAGAGLVGFEPDQGLVDQPGQVGDEPVLRPGDRGLGIHERDRLGAEVGGLLGDLAGLPRLQPTSLHQCPQSGQPVAQLQRVGDQSASGPVRDVEGGGELLNGSLGDLWGAGPGEVVGMGSSSSGMVSSGSAQDATGVWSSTGCRCTIWTASASSRASDRSA